MKIHLRPKSGNLRLRCCGVSIMSPELSALDQVTDDPSKVTCAKGRR